MLLESQIMERHTAEAKAKARQHFLEQNLHDVSTKLVNEAKQVLARSHPLRPSDSDKQYDW